MIEIEIEYYAILREQRGCERETYETESGTVSDLYEELCERYGFALPPDRVKVAVNETFSDWSSPICEGDTVVFIPPVAGG